MPEQPPTLRDMINAALTSGLTYRQLGERAIDPATGKTASKAIFFDIATGKLDRIPRDYHLRAIAAGLRQPYEIVRRAAIAQWLPAEEDLEAERLEEIRTLRGLKAQTDEMLARLLAHGYGSDDDGEIRRGA